MLKRFLNLRIRMRPVGEVAVLDRREVDDQIDRQFLALVGDNLKNILRKEFLPFL